MDAVLAAGAVVLDAAGRLLLVRRARDPQRGRWSLPGGKAHPHETLAETAERETLEETGLRVRAGRELWVATVATEDGREYEIHALLGTDEGGVLKAGDDADDARWFAPEQLRELPLTTGLLEHLERSGVVTGPVSGPF